MKSLWLIPLLCSLALGQGIGGTAGMGGNAGFGGGAPSGGGATTVTKLGSCQSSFSTNCTLTLVGGSGVGTGIVVVGYSTAAPSSTSITVANSGTANTWQADIFSIHSANSAYIANAIAPGGTLTITPSAGGSDAWGFIAYQLSSMASSSWLDASKQQTMAFGTSSSISTSSGTVHQPNINLLNCGSGTANTDTVSGYTALETSTGVTGVTPSRTLWTWWNRVTATGTQSATLTLTTNDNPDCELLSYKAN